MATNPKALEYVVRLKDLASTALKRFGDNAEKAAGRARKAFSGLTKVLSNVGKATAAVVTGAFLVGMKKGIDRALAFEKAMAEVNTILGAGGLTIQQATEQVNALALQLGKPAPEVAAGLYQTLSAGVTDSTQAMILLEGATKAGIAGLATTGEAVDLLTTKFNAYGETVTEEAVAKTSDLIFKTIQLGKTTMPELSSAMGQVLPTAAQLGVSFEEVAAAVASLTLKGVSTSEAVTQVNAVFTAFLRKGEQAAKDFPEIANLMGANAIKTKGFRQAIVDLNAAMGGSEDSLQQLMGRTEGVKAVLSLTAGEAKVFDEQLRAIADSAGAAEQAFQKMADTGANRLAIVQESLTQGFAELTQELLVGVTGGATSFETFTESAGSLKDALAGLEPLVNGIGFAIGVIATGVVALGTAVHSLVFLTQAAGNALGMVSDTDFDEMRASFGDTLTALTAASETTANLGRGFIGLEQQAMDATNSIVEFNREIRKNAAQMQLTEAIASKVYGNITKALENTHLVLEEGTQNYRDLERLGMLPLKAAAEGAAGAFDDLGKSAADAAEDVEAALEPVLRMAPMFSKARLEASAEHLERMKENENIIQMMMDDGHDKEVARIQARSTFEMEAFRLRKEAKAVELREKLEEAGVDEEIIQLREAAFFTEMQRQVARFNEARTAMEERELARLNKKREDEQRTERDIARDRERFLAEYGEAVQAGLQGPIQFGIAMGAKLGVDAAESELQRLKQEAVNIFGPQLAEALGGATGALAGYFTVTPQLELDFVEQQLRESAGQIEGALAAGIITEEQAVSLEAMIANVREFALVELEAAAAAQAFKEGLEGASEAEKGLAMGLYEFQETLPSLSEQLADITNKGLELFASGLTNALMDFATGSKSASEAFKDFARQMITQITAMIVQMLILRAIAAAIPGFGAFMGLTGFAQGGVAEGGLTPLAKGGVVRGGLGRAMPVRGYATGGPIVDSPHLAVIGEGKHNEAVVPLPDGRSIPVDLGGSAGGTSVNFSISAVDARGVDELLVERQDTIRGLIRQAMTEDRLFRQTFRGRG